MDIHVCIGSACHLKGSYDVIKEFQRVIKNNKLDDKITLKGAFCLNHCTKAVSTKIDDGEVQSMSVDKVEPLIKELVLKNKWSI